MSGENWEKAKRIFADALKIAPAERVRFLDENCDDADTRREVESLLASFDDAGSFMEKPAAEEVTGVLEIGGKKLEKGACFAHYEIIRQIGAGGMGEVYLAKDKKLDRRVAVKILNEKFSRDESNLNRFIREAKAASALNHPNILVIHEIGESEDANYTVSEFIEGETLRERFNQPPMKLSEVLDIAVQIANALVAAHAAHIVHRDIKPENIMRRVKDEEYILIDFGAVKEVATTILDSGGTPTSSIVIGSPGFMPNEQAAGKPVFASDLYALALTAVYLLTTKRPQAMNDLTTGDIAWRKFAPNVSADLAAVLDKAIEERARDRFLTSREMLTALQPTPKHSQPISAAINQQPQAIVVNRAETVVLERANTNQAVSPHTIKNSIGMEFVKIPAGSFMMGSPESEKGSYDDERPQRRVTISRDFYMSRTLVTQEQWRAVMGNNPSRFKNCAKCPVEQVSWEDAQEFIKKLNARNEGVYRLPTEAEWEYAPALERREHMREI